MQVQQVYELNVDGLVGPNHNYAGLSVGNIASTTNALSSSNPQAAALQGIAKMRLLHQLGLKQALLPPHQRPNLHLLHQLGFTGTPAQQIKKAYHLAPALLSASYSASAMWTANAATVSSSLDTADNRVHFTAANLISNLHRHQEAAFTHEILRKIFSDKRFFMHHQVLPCSFTTSDEGAANHSRLCASHNSAGINLFVYGKEALKIQQADALHKYPARQTLEASQAIARSHLLNPNKVIFVRQNPKVIDQGVFHNDVIAVANESVLFIHEEAFVNQADVLSEIQHKADFLVQIIEVGSQRISVFDAVNSYLFNSQLITLPVNKPTMCLIAPGECENHPSVKLFIEEVIADPSNPISQVYYLDLKQSMRNGGGPACLRLRVPLTQDELSAMHQEVLVTEPLLDNLEDWVMRHYRNQLHPNDLADPQFIDECFSALDELSQLFSLGSIYPFQREING
ncbi:N-succinylarginine dihydrolase [Legionella micdadei]|uniref:N-succinylarginine dihydrolase n=1 Tax=Legionella micdadei TaxID=451 RepID=A0A098GI89_LEGMI|nr:N-succinylarginine dihydrolase [Legionella micdadei]ARG97347.1 succinylarginine dihydrolase [Legionella micdadei]ARH00345.1 succinylarginine dihydrolase [Legionella micdadei]KTD28232.1 succinylarginine dihydrolase [Legionella micdadei]NSL16861.1 N-succinylarginine dihydrolase [Legionella micdadei]CEG61181.1 N-succinylarginine dihydrolase [Legionella micdadei]